MTILTWKAGFNPSVSGSLHHPPTLIAKACLTWLPFTPLQVSASGEGSSISGYLSRCKRGKRHWKKLWFVIKGKVLYTYTASEVRAVRERMGAKVLLSAHESNN